MRKFGRLFKSSIWLELFRVFPKTPKPIRMNRDRTIGNRPKCNGNGHFRRIFNLQTCYTFLRQERLRVISVPTWSAPIAVTEVTATPSENWRKSAEGNAGHYRLDGALGCPCRYIILTLYPLSVTNPYNDRRKPWSVRSAGDHLSPSGLQRGSVPPDAG